MNLVQFFLQFFLPLAQEPLHYAAAMLQILAGGMGLELSVKGLPKWMNKMNPDKMSSADRHHIVSAPATPPRVPSQPNVWHGAPPTSTPAAASERLPCPEGPRAASLPRVMASLLFSPCARVTRRPRC